MKEYTRQKIWVAVKELFGNELPSFDLSEIEVVRPKDEQFGEYTTNIALVLGKKLGIHPREVAQKIESRINPSAGEAGNQESPTPHPTEVGSSPRAGERDSDLFEKIEVAGPGHINFYVSQEALVNVLKEAIENGEHFGDAKIGEGKKVDNEFISANPTGPLHLGNARGGFYGDVISRVLRKVGYEVINEYYVNDAGEQIAKLGHSVLKDEEAVYGGEYIDALRQRITNHESRIMEGKEVVRKVGKEAAEIVLEEMIKKTVAEKMHISFDLWVSEKKDIIEGGYVDRAIERLKEKELTFENEGALWLKTTEFGDDKDRVLVKSNGERTYFASDCGYILHKMERNFVSLIEIWGADHHGYTVRFEAAARALGFEGSIKFFLMQLVRLMKDGTEVRMSKRAGNVVTVDELLEKISVDVARFFFLLYSPDTHMNFDLGLAEERSAKNPVYYVQYAHARLASILRKANEAGMLEKGPSFSDSRTVLGAADFSLLAHPKERELLREILFFSELVEEISGTYTVHKLPQYAIRLADKLHSFYDECRVIDETNPELTKARLALITGIKTALGSTLGLMGITAPERMEQGSENREQGA